MAHPSGHFEIPAQDLGRVRRFYTDLLGWDIQAPRGMPDYMLVTTAREGEAGINGGLIQRRAPQQAVTNYAQVESVADYAEKVKQLGGQVVMGKTAVPKMGYFAVCLDPEGNPLGLWEDDPNAA